MAEKKTPPFNPAIKKEVEDEGDDAELTPKKKTPEKIEDDEKDEDEEDEEEDDEADEDKDEDEELDETKIPVRKSTAQFIIGRQKKTIEKLREKKADDAEETEEAEDEELSPEASKAVGKAVSKAVNPIIGTLAEQADETELQNLFTQEPEAEKYEKRIRSYMKNPHWSAVPVEAIFHHLAFNNAETTGARKKDTADKETQLNRNGGRTLRPKAKGTGDLPSVDEMEDMSDEEIEGIQHKVRTGRYDKKEE